MRDGTVAESRDTARGRDRRHSFPGRARKLTPRFSDDELSKIVRAAEAVGMTATGFCAEAAVAAARGTRPASLDPTRELFVELQGELFDVRVAVGRIGTNLNQAVAAFNATGDPPVWLVRAVELCEQRMARVDAVIAEVDRRLR